MALVHINSDWKALVASSYIDDVVRKKTGARYVLGNLCPGENNARNEIISFLGRAGDYILPKNTPVEAVLLGKGTFRQEEDDDENVINVLASISTPVFLQGVKLPVDSPYFEKFKKGNYFVTGVIYDASEKKTATFYRTVPAPQPEALQAHCLLYNDTKDTREIPKELSLADRFHIIHGRVSELSSVVGCPSVSPRTWADISVSTLFYTPEELKR